MPSYGTAPLSGIAPQLRPLPPGGGRLRARPSSTAWAPHPLPVHVVQLAPALCLGACDEAPGGPSTSSRVEVLRHPSAVGLQLRHQPGALVEEERKTRTPSWAGFHPRGRCCFMVRRPDYTESLRSYRHPGDITSPTRAQHVTASTRCQQLSRTCNWCLPR